MTTRYTTLLLTFALGLFTVGEAAAQEEVTLEPSKDNSMYEEGELSNGAGEYLFAGRTGTNVQNGPWNRRVLLAFDVAGALPENGRVDSIAISLNMSRVPAFGATDTEMTLHRLTRDWGEGTSDAPVMEGNGTDATTGDATWTYAFFDTEQWSTSGGDFEDEPSVTFPVGMTNGPVTVPSSDALVADVQLWHDDPESNFGWILIGDESQQHTARRFDSREFDNADRRPQLTIYYTETTSSERDDLPRSLALGGNYPNPFERSTTIRYELDKPDRVTLEVFDLAGRSVLEISEGMKTAGPHSTELSSGSLAAGTYVYCLQGAESARECRSMVILP